MIELSGEPSRPLCLVCRERPTIRAHLLPESFVREIFHQPKDDEKHMIVDPETGRKVPSNTGRFDRNILCADCDNVLGGYEDTGFRLLKRLRAVEIGQKDGTNSYIDEGTYRFSVEVADEIIRFACGILWKYSSIPSGAPGYIDIGECRALFENICWRGVPVPAWVDAFIERDLFTFAAFPDPEQVYYYCSPTVGRRGYRTNHNFAWFSVGGFTIYVKLNQPGSSDFAPKRCWLRGRKHCQFLVDSRSINVNRGIHESIDMTRDDLARLNRSIQAQYASGRLFPTKQYERRTDARR
jgi:hypothetical protein